MKTKKDSKLWLIFTAVFAFIALIYIVIVHSNILSNSDLPLQLIGTVIGMILSAFITVLLLKGQTAIEEQNDLGLRVFEKKQEVYHTFINELEKITQDGKLNVPRGKKFEESPNSEIYDELQHLIYQLGFVQMHAAHEIAEEITEKVGKLVGTLSVGNANAMYPELADVIFQIVALLRKDLYNSANTPIKKEKISETLRLAGCFDEDFCSQVGSYNVMKDYIENLIKLLKKRQLIEKFQLSAVIRRQILTNA